MVALETTSETLPVISSNIPLQVHLLLADYYLQTIQKLLGHSDIKTTMIYLQTVPGVTLKEAKSPLDL
jgi:integrase